MELGMLPQPSLSVRVWNRTPHLFLVKAAKLTRTGIGLPEYYNDEVIIPSLMNRGLTLDDVEPLSQEKMEALLAVVLEEGLDGQIGG